MKKIRVKISIYLILGILCMTSLSACKKFIDIPPPTTEVTTASVFNNNATATSAILNIYYTMDVNNEDSYYLASTTGLLSDELTNYSSSPIDKDYYTNSMNVADVTGRTSGGETGCWGDAYNCIYQANAVISGLQNNTGVTLAAKQQLTGEAYFIRAFWHFTLTNVYGDVPLALTTDYTVTSKLSRTPQKLVYQQCISDLKVAESLLNSNYVDASDTTVTTERVRPNKYAAEALLAKIYLYADDYQDAKTAASSVISNTGLYSIDTDPNNVFLKNSTEAILQLQAVTPQRNNGATWDGQNFILTAPPTNGYGGANCTTISPQLMAAFEPGDTRQTKWISSLTIDGQTYYFPFKYKYNGNTAGGTNYEYTMVLRLAEQYLILAEAEANLNDMGDATTNLNIIRSRAGLPPSSVLTPTATLAQAESAILHERQVELFTEWGDRWFDLRRTGTIDAVMSVVKPLKSGGNSWSNIDALFPIPLSEVGADPKLTQNLGY